ncbi:16S rRNA (cytosine(1402)-N(4))-methyltransferase RsmH [Rickettsiales bacterium]|nr:16S rRNA (cytosine(1402)-N(4))-methyltransferase RsmH [Rickettsiales bacterium]
MHKSVLIDQIIDYLQPSDGKNYIDGTFGAGGYSKKILEAANCNILAFDRDQNVIDIANNFKKEFGNNFDFISSEFANIKQHLNGKKYDALILDLGVSSMQIDQADRGFSFQKDSKLDMRMDQTQKLSAFEVVNYTQEDELANIIYNYGDERKSRRIAKLIVENRKINKIETTSQLSEIVKKAVGQRGFSKIDPSTKTFQAIRIFVNDELGQLEKILADSADILQKDGKLIIVSFHSLEDRIVKNFIKKNSGYDNRATSRYEPQSLTINEIKHSFSCKKLKAIKPTEEEIKKNIRARSARMRIAIKN